MAATANGDIYVMRAYCLLANQIGITRVHCRLHTLVGTMTDADLAAGWDALIDGAMKALIVIDASYRGVGVQRRRPAPTTIEAFSTTGAGAGVTATPPLPKQVSGLIKYGTAFAGRRFRGRGYVPFPSEADNESVFGRPSADYVTRLNTLGALMVTPWTNVNGANSIAVVPGLFNETTSVFTDFTSRTARSFWASQRRRGDFGPTNISPI